MCNDGNLCTSLSHQGLLYVVEPESFSIIFVRIVLFHNRMFRSKMSPIVDTASFYVASDAANDTETKDGIESISALACIAGYDTVF
jgi:hypothetical protein